MEEGVVEIQIPKLGTGSPIVVAQWFYDEGDFIEEGDDLVELRSENKKLIIVAPLSGVLSNIFYYEGEEADEGEVIAEIEEEEE